MIKYTKDGIEVAGDFISLKEIIENCNSIKIKSENLVLLTMGWSGRSGDICERIALPLDKANRVKEILLNKEVYFGEIWGKHSEVYGTMDEDTFEINKNKKEVQNFINIYPSKHEYDHSFIYHFIEDNEYNEMQDGVTKEIINELQEIING